jgi:choline-sulfatase
MDLDRRVDLGFDQKETAHGHDSGGDVTALFRRPLCYRIGERPDIDGRILRNTHRDAAVLNVALEFLRDEAPRRPEPWALYVGFVGPLPGFQVEPKYAKMYAPGKVPLPDVPAPYLENLPEPWEATRAYKRIATPIPEDRMRRAIAAYYGNVTAVDERIGQVLDQLTRSNLRENTVVVLTADHGRSLGEHGLWFHNEPTDHSSRVPLVIAGPGLPKGRRIATPVMHADLFPTLVEFAGAPAPPGLRGHSLLPMLEDRSGSHAGVAYSELHAEGTCTGSFIIRRGDWKYIHYTWYDSLLFNLANDPGEMHDVIKTPEGARVAAGLHRDLVSLVDPTAVTERAFAVQEKILQDLCARMTLEELLEFGFERRLGRAQAITLLKRFKT